MQTVRLFFSRPVSRLSGQNSFNDHENEEEGGLQGWVGHVDVYRWTEKTTKCVLASVYRIACESNIPRRCSPMVCMAVTYAA